MTFSYDPTDLDTSTESGRLNVTRLLLGDTDTNDQLLSDEEITFILSENNNNVYISAAYCARSIGSKLAREVDVKLDGALSESGSSLSTQFFTLADKLEMQAKMAGAQLGVSAGGITLTSIKSTLLLPNRVPSSFRMRQYDNPPDYDLDLGDYDD